MASSDLPAFKRPPVIETVLGVQFDRLPAFHNFHLGVFWKSLGSGWPNATDASALAPQFERFGDSVVWGQPGMRLKLTEDVSSRIQIKNSTEDRMIQAQNGRLHFNWLGQGGGEYPRYSAVRLEFDSVLELFQQFLAAERLGEMRPNQWEVTYVNHIPRGTVWNSAHDWPALFRSVAMPPTQLGAVSMEGLNSEWHYEIEPQRGRLHVQLKDGVRKLPPEGTLLVLTLTARGPILEAGPNLSAGLDLGREAIVRTFAAITSEAAHQFWEPIHGSD